MQIGELGYGFEQQKEQLMDAIKEYSKTSVVTEVGPGQEGTVVGLQQRVNAVVNHNAKVRGDRTPIDKDAPATHADPQRRDASGKIDQISIS